MDSLTWHKGQALKRALEMTGRDPSVDEFAVALWIKAREQGLTLEEIVHSLIGASTFNPPKVDRGRNLKELGF